MANSRGVASLGNGLLAATLLAAALAPAFFSRSVAQDSAVKQPASSPSQEQRPTPEVEAEGQSQTPGDQSPDDASDAETSSSDSNYSGEAQTAAQLQQAAGMAAVLSLLPQPLTLEAVNGLPDNVKEALQKRRERFERLTQQEQAQLRSLHRELNAHEDAERLERVLVNYNRWLESLTSIERAELADMSLEARVARIKEMKRQQEEKTLQELADRAVNRADIEAIQEWANQMAIKHDASLLALAQQGHYRGPAWSNRRPGTFQVDEQGKPRANFVLYFFPISRLTTVLTDSDVNELSAQLSPNAAEVLNRTNELQQRLEQIGRWLIADFASRMRASLSPEVLEKFFREELTDGEREDLDRRSPQDRMEALRDLYLRRQFPRNRGRGPSRSSNAPL